MEATPKTSAPIKGYRYTVTTKNGISTILLRVRIVGRLSFKVPIDNLFPEPLGIQEIVGDLPDRTPSPSLLRYIQCILFDPPVGIRYRDRKSDFAHYRRIHDVV